ncbi:hypothetical protein HG530_014641 [Fusarium avenaceum]|nr:hypothetical protein HG530_014641 [Fusarium avenaceum]
MGDQSQSKIIVDNPIGNGIDAFRGSFSSICTRAGLAHIPDTLGQLEHEGPYTYPPIRAPNSSRRLSFTFEDRLWLPLKRSLKTCVYRRLFRLRL